MTNPSWIGPEKRDYRKVEIRRLAPQGNMLSSRAPLLAPSPLRTGLEGFPSSGSSTHKRPPEKKRGRGLIQNE